MTCRIPDGLALLCPLTNLPTQPVDPLTLSHHAAVPTPPEVAFGFCDSPTCDVVYVGADGTLLYKEQVRTRVGIKEVEEPIPVCYCFEFTTRQIRDDLLEHGQSTVRRYIQEQVGAGNCRCEVTNPSGRCCLGNVGRVLTSLSERRLSR